MAVDQVSGKFYITRPGYPGPQSDPRLIEYETVAYDASGNQLWMTRYHASTNAYPVAVAVDPRSGHLYVTGSTPSDYVTVAYDGDGHELWVARYNQGLAPAFSDQNFANAIAVDPNSGNVYVTGGSGPYYFDYATVVYDPSGNQLWVARYHGIFTGDDLGDDAASAIAVDPSSGGGLCHGL